jgi:hypothetical protein
MGETFSGAGMIANLAAIDYASLVDLWALVAQKRAYGFILETAGGHRGHRGKHRAHREMPQKIT